jgi:hypothetical protein
MTEKKLTVYLNENIIINELTILLFRLQIICFMLTRNEDICLYSQFRLCLFWIRIEMSPSEG